VDSPFFKNFHKEILKYRTADEFEACLIQVMESGNKLMKTIQAAEEYVRKNTAEKIAERYIELFQKLLAQRELGTPRTPQDSKAGFHAEQASGLDALQIARQASLERAGGRTS